MPLLIIVTLSISRDISPLFRLSTSGLVSDFVVDSGKIYIATNQGSIDIFDFSTQKIVDRILLEPTRTMRGELVPRAIYSVDRLQGKTLFVSSGSEGYRDLWLKDGLELKKLMAREKIVAKKARFVDDDQIVLGTFGSDAILYDQSEGYTLYHEHLSQSALGGMILSDDKKTMVMADESGAVRIVDVATSEVKEIHSSQNLDNVYRVAYRDGTLLTAGQDRRVGVYPRVGEAYHIRSDFLVYAVGLSPSAKVGVYSSGVEHHLQLFDLSTKALGDRLIGHRSVVNKIEFLSEKILISAGEERDVYVWSLE